MAPKFLEQELNQEYGNSDHAVYGTLNKIGAMHGNKETAKGRAMQKKHNRKGFSTKNVVRRRKYR